MLEVASLPYRLTSMTPSFPSGAAWIGAQVRNVLNTAGGQIIEGNHIDSTFQQCFG
jgi:hypothetical protein